MNYQQLKKDELIKLAKEQKEQIDNFVSMTSDDAKLIKDMAEMLRIEADERIELENYKANANKCIAELNKNNRQLQEEIKQLQEDLKSKNGRNDFIYNEYQNTLVLYEKLNNKYQTAKEFIHYLTGE